MAKLGGRSFGRDQLGNADAEAVVEHEDFATGDQPAVDEDVDGVAGELVERHDGALFELQHLFELHVGAAELDLEVELDVAEQFERSRLGRETFLPGCLNSKGFMPGGKAAGTSTDASACLACSKMPSMLSSRAAGLGGGGEAAGRLPADFARSCSIAA